MHSARLLLQGVCKYACSEEVPEPVDLQGVTLCMAELKSIPHTWTDHQPSVATGSVHALDHAVPWSTVLYPTLPYCSGQSA